MRIKSVKTFTLRILSFFFSVSQCNVFYFLGREYGSECIKEIIQNQAIPSLRCSPVDFYQGIKIEMKESLFVTNAQIQSPHCTFQNNSIKIVKRSL